MTPIFGCVEDYLILQPEWASFTWLKDQRKKKCSVMSFCTQIAPFSLSCTIYYQRTTNSNGNILDHCTVSLKSYVTNLAMWIM